MNKTVGSAFDCGWQDWLHDRKCDPHCYEDEIRYDDLTMDQMLEYIKGWNEAKEFYRGAKASLTNYDFN